MAKYAYLCTQKETKQMRKALMYLLLSLGIILVVMFVSGAAIGFMGSFIDGFFDGLNGNDDAPSKPSDLYFVMGMAILCVACAILQIVFLRLRFASYTFGRIPKEKRGSVILWTMVALGGLSLLYCTMSDPFSSPDEAIRDSFGWMTKRPIPSILGMGFIEATADLIIFGGMMREILEWKHRPQIVITVFAAIMCLITVSFSEPTLAIPAMMVGMVEGYVYEYTRSVIPIIIGDIFYWIILVLLIGVSIPGWCAIIAIPLIVLGFYSALKTMEPFKPID